MPTNTPSPFDDDAPVPHPLERKSGQSDNRPGEPSKPKAYYHTSTYPYFTYALIVINVIIFFVGSNSQTVQNQWFVQGANYAPMVLHGNQPYRLFTSMFLHGGIQHIGMNMIVLYGVGKFVELVFGNSRFVVIYLLGGLGGSVLSVMFGDYWVPSIGASGAVFAVWAARGLHLYQNRHLYGPRIYSELRIQLVWGAVTIFTGFLSPNIDNWAHIGGIVGGLILTWFLGPHLFQEQIPVVDDVPHYRLTDTLDVQKRLWFILVYGLSLIILLALAERIIGPTTSLF